MSFQERQRRRHVESLATVRPVEAAALEGVMTRPESSKLPRWHGHTRSVSQCVNDTLPGAHIAGIMPAGELRDPQLPVSGVSSPCGLVRV